MPLGKVYLVGAGPGDPGLLTVRGLDLIRQAEVIIYDRLVNPALLEEAPSAAARIFAGKATGLHSLPQEEINELMIAHARRGRRVIRLKGGDPFVFGRGGEEAEALAAAGIQFEVVPGVSSAMSVPAYAGIPLTHRQLSSSFAVITGHEACKAGAKIDWQRLATGIDTLVVLMGLKNLPRIAAQLIAHGRAPATPIALIRWGTTQKQEVVTGTLADIIDKSQSLRPPVVIVIGEVVKLRMKLDWFDAAPASTNFANPVQDGDQTPSRP
ncbi:MAG TPA: uroporphyrinogen-III C-methyltransferase [Candidatus Binatia bacterium]|jgi:uroporphyrin-III C-methyltransferase